MTISTRGGGQAFAIVVPARVVEIPAVLDTEGVAVEGLIGVTSSEERGAVWVLCGCYFGGGVEVARGRPEVRGGEMSGFGATGRSGRPGQVWPLRQG